MIIIPSRFNGPPTSGNGGYTCGTIAEALGVTEGESAVVTLRSPPPLDTEMVVEHEDDGLRVLAGDRLIAEATRSTLDLDAPAPVSFADAAAASAPPPHHPFPTCFVCGPARDDGLAITVGPVPGRDVMAGPWIPAPDVVGRVFVWAALDCPGAWVRSGTGGMLGRLEARVDACPEPGDRCVVVAWLIDEPSERRWISGTALFADSGKLLGVARATWVALRT